MKFFPAFRFRGGRRTGPSLRQDSHAVQQVLQLLPFQGVDHLEGALEKVHPRRLDAGAADRFRGRAANNACIFHGKVVE